MKKMTFSLLAAAAVLAAPVSAYAMQDAPGAVAAAVAVKKNQTIVDANGRILGKVFEVNAERGFVSFMSQMKIYRVPLASLSADGARLKTTLTRAQVGL